MKPSEIREGAVYSNGRNLRRRVLRVWRVHPSADFDVRYHAWDTLKPASQHGPHECFRITFAAWAKTEVPDGQG